MFAEIYLWIWKYDTFFPHCSCNCPYWRRKWQPILVFLPGEFQGQRSLMGCCPWNRKELDTTEQLLFPLSHTLTCDSVSGHQYLHEDTAIVWVHPNTSCCYWPARLFIPLVKWSHSVMYNLLWPHGLQSPWNSPGQNTGIPFSRVSSQPRDRTQVSHTAGRFFTIWATREVFIPLRSLIFNGSPLPSKFCLCCVMWVHHVYDQWSIEFASTQLTSIKAAATAAAKSLQSCPTLCDPIDSSPPGSSVPRILQARTLEWVAISFSNAWKWKVKVKSLSRVRPFATP